MSATIANSTETCTQSPRFSRYRSVRRAAAAAIPEDAPAVPELNTNQLNRVPSRYHRAQKPRAQTIPIPAQPPKEKPLVSSPIQHKSQPVAAHRDVPTTDGAVVKPVESTVRKPTPTRPHGDHDFVGGPVRSQSPPTVARPSRERQRSRTTSTGNRSPPAAIPKSYEAAREEARMILEGEYDRLQNLKELQERPERKPQPKSSELKRRPTQIQQPTSPPVFKDAPTLKVKRRIERTLPDKYHDAPKPVKARAPIPVKDSRTDRPQFIDQPAPVLSRAQVDAPIPAAQRHLETPKFDAPISAVNAGDRRVEIRLNNAERGITLPVTPSTNSRDLLNSASIVMSEDFDPRTSVLVESFSKLGLERPLRRYEHIRDVMNSWDTDDQNHLTIMTKSECQATGLDLSEAPEDTPCRTMVQMYLSLRPGKWEKRWIILRPDGQVTMSKQENDGDGTNICHLSDFDVYTPTAKQRKKLRPPKKICFAVKSQQKSAMFLEGINFVHFFATSEKHIADEWYTAVQSWRSWYLVHVLGEGSHKVKDVVVLSAATGNTEARPTTAHSTESVPYQLGSFKPLLDLGELDFNFSNTSTQPSEHLTSKKPSMDLGTGTTSFDLGTSEATRRASRPRNMPPSAFPSKLILEAENRRGPSIDNSSDQAFTGGGLLARSASTRRSRGGAGSGHGVTGQPGRPLVDLSPASNFAEGSLLRKLEAWSTAQGEHEPKVDRQRRHEADIKVGEGLA